jgi:DNA-binding CsgD family transcriptional regulator
VDRLLAELDLDPVAQVVIGAHLLALRALVEVHGGHPSDALRTIARLDAAAPEPFHEGAADTAYVLARAGAALGDASALAQGRARSAELSRLAGGPGVIGLAESVRGFSASLEGRGDEAARHFASAAEQYERAPRAVMAAEAWCDAAAAAGTGPLATAALDRAQRLSDSNGLERVARRIADVRRAERERPARLPSELLDLTPREREVALLAAEGMTNREIGARLYLSEGTVRNYLSTAFGKLGIARRAELGRLLAIRTGG